LLNGNVLLNNCRVAASSIRFITAQDITIKFFALDGLPPRGATNRGVTP